jgi:predicted lipoprotein with Yx(FWY)xxD motif
MPSIVAAAACDATFPCFLPQMRTGGAGLACACVAEGGCRRASTIGDANAGDIKGDASTGGGPTAVWFVLRQPAYTVLTLTSTTGTTRLTDASGRSLYYFAQDTVGNPPTSACDGVAGDRTTCVGNWPIFLATTTVVPTGIDPARFTVFTHADQTQQSAFDGHPLYYFVDDAVPGDVKGLTFPPGLGNWFTIDPAAL